MLLYQDALMPRKLTIERQVSMVSAYVYQIISLEPGMSEQLDLLLQIGVLLGRLLYPLVLFIVNWLPLLLWAAWWLWAADWKKIWPILGQGAWMPAILLLIGGALAWSQIA